MSHSLRRHALTVLVASCAWFAAQEPAPPPAVERIEIGEHVTFESKVLGETRRLRISVPEHYASLPDGCCVLYMLDGDSLFVPAVASARHLGEFDAPPIIVVGIDNTERTRDLTPPATDAKTKADFPTGGGSAAFRRFLVDELKPFIEGRYRTNGIDVLAGHSFGGLFAAETLLEEPEAFDGYLVLSPSFWWDDRSFVRRFETVEPDHGMFQRFTWFAMGDEGMPMNPPFEAVTWAVRERAPSGYRWGKGHFPGHDHWAAALPSLNAGLRAYFEPIRTVGEGAMTFEAVAADFALVRAEFGDAVRLTAGPIVRTTRGMLERREYDAALAMIDGAMEAIDDQPLLHYVRGEVLVGAERFDEAIEAYTAAIAEFESEARHAGPVKWLRQALETAKSKRAAR